MYLNSEQWTVNGGARRKVFGCLLLAVCCLLLGACGVRFDMILPGMGVISELISNFSRKKIFGYEFIAFSSIAIAVFGFLVWGHHMASSDEAEKTYKLQIGGSLGRW